MHMLYKGERKGGMEEGREEEREGKEIMEEGGRKEGLKEGGGWPVSRPWLRLESPGLRQNEPFLFIIDSLIYFVIVM